MFIEFQVANFRSFRDLTTLSMRAAPKRTNDHGEHEENVYEAGGLRMLKSKAIYGANASGKSNLAMALGAFRHLISDSVSREQLPQDVWEFRFKLATDWEEQPVFFQGTFLIQNQFYRYGFEIINKIIDKEWMFVRNSLVQEETECFFRESANKVRTNEVFMSKNAPFAQQLAQNNHEIFRADALYLTSAALSGVETAWNLREAIRGISGIDGINDKASEHLALEILESNSGKEKRILNGILQAADIGLEEVRLLELPEDVIPSGFGGQTSVSDNLVPKKEKHLISLHTRYDDEGLPAGKIATPFEDWESKGTIKLLTFSAFLFYTLRDGRTLVVDEFDARFHPNLTLKIVELFHSSDTNPNNAQLIFVTHDSSLLERAALRRDQIAFIEKDRYGISTLTTLIEYKGVRKDASYEKDYLQGRYQGIPALSKVNWVVKEIFEKDELQETE